MYNFNYQNTDTIYFIEIILRIIIRKKYLEFTTHFDNKKKFQWDPNKKVNFK